MERDKEQKGMISAPPKMRYLFEQRAPAAQVLEALRESFGGLTAEAQEALMQVVKAPLCGVTHSNDYVKRVIRCVMESLESEGVDPQEALVLHYASLMVHVPSPAEDLWTCKVFTYGRSDGVEIGKIAIQTCRDMLRGGTGCKEWEAGILMGQFVLNHPQLFADCAVMELGCGVGFTGMCLHATQRLKQLVLSDGNKEALENCMKNLTMNGIAFSNTQSQNGLTSEGVHVIHLDWSDRASVARPDIIIGADLLYDSSIIPELVGLIVSLLSSGEQGDECFLEIGPQQHVCVRYPFCLLLTIVRNEKTLGCFMEAAEASGLVLEDISDALTAMDVHFFCLPVKEHKAVLHLLQCPLWQGSTNEHAAVVSTEHS